MSADGSSTRVVPIALLLVIGLSFAVIVGVAAYALAVHTIAPRSFVRPPPPPAAIFLPTDPDEREAPGNANPGLPRAIGRHVLHGAAATAGFVAVGAKAGAKGTLRFLASEAIAAMSSAAGHVWRTILKVGAIMFAMKASMALPRIAASHTTTAIGGSTVYAIGHASRAFLLSFLLMKHPFATVIASSARLWRYCRQRTAAATPA